MKDNTEYIRKIIDDIDFVLNHTINITIEMLEGNPVLLDSMMFRLIQISENANRIKEDYKFDHDEIPWMEISGLRNRIVHDYGNVDLKVVFDTLIYDIPDLKERFIALYGKT